MRVGIVLFNLGGPDNIAGVEPFLRNLFSDPAIIRLPGFLRLPLARWIAARRAPLAQKIYAHLGGGSPIRKETEAQARALAASLVGAAFEFEIFIAMRYSEPGSEAAVRAMRTFAPDRIVLLPLYPQFSTTTTGSSFDDWDRAAAKVGLTAPTSRICCYSAEAGFVAGLAEHIRAAMASRKPGLAYRLLLSAHGLPKRIVERGDPYQWQVERTAAALVDALGIRAGGDIDHQVCYQSRVGPLEWLGPATDAEIRRAGTEGRGVIIAPIAFVSEHSETLVELDIEYGKLAQDAGVPDYRRVPTVGADAAFIDGLAGLVTKALNSGGTINDGSSRLCPDKFGCCALETI